MEPLLSNDNIRDDLWLFLDSFPYPPLFPTFKWSVTNPTDSYYKMADRTLLSYLSSLLIILLLCLKVFSGYPYVHYKVRLILTVAHNKDCLWHSTYFPFRPHSSTLVLHNAIIIAIPWMCLASFFYDFAHRSHMFALCSLCQEFPLCQPHHLVYIILELAKENCLRKK